MERKEISVSKSINLEAIRRRKNIGEEKKKTEPRGNSVQQYGRMRGN